MEYFAPSKDWSELTGITLHNDWGLTGHAGWQRRLIPDGTYRSAQEDVIEEVLLYATDRLRILNDRYSVAFGMISQFNEDDIVAFCNGLQGQQCWNRDRPIEARYGRKMQWVASERTFALLACAVAA